MNQSSYIAAFLLAGFVLYLAAKGRLTAYTAVLWGNTAAALPSLSSSATTTKPSDNVVPIPGSSGLNLSNPLAGLPSWIGVFLGAS